MHSYDALFAAAKAAFEDFVEQADVEEFVAAKWKTTAWPDNRAAAQSPPLLSSGTAATTAAPVDIFASETQRLGGLVQEPDVLRGPGQHVQHVQRARIAEVADLALGKVRQRVGRWEAEPSCAAHPVATAARLSPAKQPAGSRVRKTGRTRPVQAQ